MPTSTLSRPAASPTSTEHLRKTWVDGGRAAVWERRLERISNAWHEIEWRAIESGIRRCSFSNVRVQRLPSQVAKPARAGLATLPVERVARMPSSYSASSRSVKPGQPFDLRVVHGNPRDCVAFRAAWLAGDDETVGELLGYPACCRRFFRQVWRTEGRIDPTWRMAQRSVGGGENGDATCLEIGGSPEANILWRWMGIRLVPHMPCSSHCEPSVEMGRAMVARGRELGYGQEMDWVLELLDWPVTWSALHGQLRIDTPLMVVSTGTDDSSQELVVRRCGTPYRPEAADASSPAGARGRASANGFASDPDMDRAHRPIVALATASLPDDASDVIDLGCGDGELLRKIVERKPLARAHGVEQDAERVRSVAATFPSFEQNFVAGDLFAEEAPWRGDRRYRLAILMPGRLIEAGPERAMWLRERIERHCDALLVYAYGDWLTRHGDLAGLARKSGLELIDARPEALAGMARFLP